MKKIKSAILLPLLTISIISLSTTPALASSHAPSPNSQKTQVNLSTTATLTTLADTLEISLNLSDQEKSSSLASSKLGELSTLLKSDLAKYGIINTAIKNDSLVIAPTYDNQTPNNITGYSASENVTITIKGIALGNQILNDLQNNFSTGLSIYATNELVSNTSNYDNKLIALAYQKAYQRAKLYMLSAGGKNLKLTSLSEQSSNPIIYPMVASALSDKTGVNLNNTSQELSLTINTQWTFSN